MHFIFFTNWIRDRFVSTVIITRPIQIPMTLPLTSFPPHSKERWTQWPPSTSGFPSIHSTLQWHRTRDGGRRVLAALSPLKPQILRVRDGICSGGDAEPRWRNRGDGAHICFCSASSSALRKSGPVEVALVENGHGARQVSLLPYKSHTHTHCAHTEQGIKGKA